MKNFIYLLAFITCSIINAQNYTSYFTGNTTNATTNPTFGICLMGGASENDNAMQWFLNLADGGDVVVLRASGSDGYNDYMFNQLGVNINSVETLRIDQPQGATESYVLEKVAQAEAIWFAGGDQADYVNYFKNNALGDLLNAHINVKQYPIGGTSAGMAIMGEYYFDAFNGTVTSSQALSNPFDNRVSLGMSDFIQAEILSNTITDTHYDNPDRRGRHLVFLARLQAQTGERVFGIGLDEFTAACIDQNGIANIYGDYPEYEDYAYFVQVNCLDDTTPESLSTNQPLDWNLNQEAVKAYGVPGVSNGSNNFDLNTWETGNGGQWENWWVDQGSFQSQTSTPIDCENFGLNEFDLVAIEIYPNPFQHEIVIKATQPIANFDLFDINGKKIKSNPIKRNEAKINLESLTSGFYFLKLSYGVKESKSFKIIKN